MVKKKFIIVVSLIVIGLIASGYYIYNNNTSMEINEITSLKQGTYHSYYPNTIYPDIVITIEDNNYTIYENSKKTDSGKTKYVGDNTFEFHGEILNFDMYVVNNDIYVCSFKNKMNYQHIELKYVSSSIAKYED